MNIDKGKLFGDFVNIKNIANINILKCYKTLFSKNGIKRNIGFLIIILIIIFHFICIILFYCKDLNILKKKIQAIIFGIMNWKLVIQEDERAKKLKMKMEMEKLRKAKEKKYNLKINKLNKNYNNNIVIKLENNIIQTIPGPIFNLVTTNNIQYFDKKDNFSNPIKKGKKKSRINQKNHYLNMIKNKYEITKKSINHNSIDELNQKQSIIQKTREIMAYNEEELNQLPYKFALQYDNRTYCQYYASLIKTKHNLIFSFFYSNDYNSRIIKIDLFYIDFVINFAINALFFDDDTMHQLYKDNGKFSFLYQLPQIIYSTLISYVINILLNFLALSEDYILTLKSNKINKNLDKKKVVLYKKLKILFLSYFIISSIFLLFFWYYISMFCAIYKNTQIHLIKDTLISFGISLISPFGIYLIPGIFRIPALSNKNNKRHCLYYISIFIQMI